MIRKEQLSPTWKRDLLRDAVEFLDYLRRPVTKIDRTDGQYPYYGANGQQGMINDFIFDEPLILLAEDGGNFGQEGRTFAYKVEGKCWVNNHAHVLRPKPNVDLNFLLRHLEYYDVTPYITGTTRAKLTKDAASRIELVLPPLPEQKRISAILDKADSIRRKRQEAVRLTEELLRSVFLEMFGDPVTNPKGWEIKSLSEEIEFLTSGSRGWAEFYSNSGRKFIRIQNVKNGLLNFNEVQYVNPPDNKEAARTKVQENDLLISITADLGRTAVVDRRTAIEGAHINQHLALVRLSKAFNPHFVAAYLESEGGKRQFLQLDQSAVKSGLNFESIKSLNLFNPPLKLQNQYASFVHALEKAKGKLRASSEVTDTLFNSLLQRAFKGEL
jgi:type I restriction enzyme S subunit